MAILVECLKCGRLRTVRGSTASALGAGHCPRCGYVGWEISAELTEDERRELREVPVERRRHVPPRRLPVVSR